MGRPRKPARIRGPYRSHRGRWRVIEADGAGGDESLYFADERTARRYIERWRVALAAKASITVMDALEQYRGHLVAKGNRESSITTTMHRLRGFLSDLSLLAGLTPQWADSRYRELAAGQRPDTHRNTLAELRTFSRWCAAKPRGWITGDPLAEVAGVGKRTRGKPQLRIDEIRRWEQVALQLAPSEPGAVAALLSYRSGLRSSEVVERVVRDLDDSGQILWIDRSKTEAGRRAVRVSDDLQPHLLRLASGREPGELLFGRHWRDWPREWVQRICALAGVPRVSAHAMRGAYATVAVQLGVPLPAISAGMGHADTAITEAAYAKRDAVEAEMRRRGMVMIKGGKR